MLSLKRPLLLPRKSQSFVVQKHPCCSSSTCNLYNGLVRNIHALQLIYGLFLCRMKSSVIEEVATTNTAYTDATLHTELQAVFDTVDFPEKPWSTCRIQWNSALTTILWEWRPKNSINASVLRRWLFYDKKGEYVESVLQQRFALYYADNWHCWRSCNIARNTRDLNRQTAALLIAPMFEVLEASLSNKMSGNAFAWNHTWEKNAILIHIVPALICGFQTIQYKGHRQSSKRSKTGVHKCLPSNWQLKHWISDDKKLFCTVPLTAGKTVLLEKLTFVQISKKLLALYGTLKFIPVLTKFCYSTTCQVNPVHTIPTVFIQDPFQYYILRVTTCLKRSLLWKFPTYILCAKLILPYFIVQLLFCEHYYL